jgi:transposase-like protein
VDAQRSGACTQGASTPWVAAAIRQAFLQSDAGAAHQTWRHVADQLRGRWPRLAALMDDSEHDVLTYMTFPAQHRAKLHSTKPLERLNKEAKVGPTLSASSPTRLALAD